MDREILMLSNIEIEKDNFSTIRLLFFSGM